jgi:hypothetical protein
MEQKSLRDVGASLGVSEDTARKRVDKALDCLTRFFRLHGFAIPAVTAAVPLFSLAAHAAPAGLASTATAAALSGAAEAVSALTLINKTLFLMATTKMKVIAGAAIVALLLISTSTVLIRHHREQINSEVQTPLEQQRAEDLRRMQEVRSAVVRMLTFASSNDGQLPRKAEDLGEDPKATAWEIVAPADFALKGDSEEIRNVNASTVIVQEKNPDKKGRRVKGYADGHSQF